MTNRLTRDFPVIVVGAGASGIGAAVRLRGSGFTDFAVLEKAAELGGTWRDNTYPGCACDVPSALYSYSFAPNPEWHRAFATQPEIRRYLADVAVRYRVTGHLRFGVEVLAARWDGARWVLETTGGRYTARVLIAGAGPWHEPKLPEIPGLADFPGESFHSARWNHDYDLTGKRVAVVGSGASAVQFVPKIAPEVAELHLFQRTAQWVLPKPDHYVPRLERWLLRTFPRAQRALRAAEYAGMEALGVGFRHPWLLRIVQRAGRLHLRATVPDPALRAVLTPDYTLGCKRLLLSNTYYRSLTKPNVTVHPTELSRIEGNVVIGADGRRSEVDAIIFGTGFHITDMPVADRVFDAQGRSLAAVWGGSPRAYLGTSVAGFPNLFLLLGPNLGTGHSSAMAIIEAQLAHVLAAVRLLAERDWPALSVRPELQERFNAAAQRALAGTVYNAGGCSSYYLDANGRNSFSWPWSTGELTRRVGEFDVADYLVHETAAETQPGPRLSS
ncbi:NAD(P)/FAD-dependent oxidoreductase [Crossiella sp. CA-258035]|uniref:flavin-containing monooxygenase n=1 Tax=Crossiella sp. CA-258035 TaxID=2981138 RepID=UPI0024BBEE70|nr:NAD(P)/FAD-dependent oxidoreductase [Crossiella sp. CA-258035]WHT21321.1 NAD(P)/FAD-dependent oxidoreductase [Crossiella sp. CA-258035]